MLQVQVAPKAFLTRLKTITPFVGRRWPKPILETVQFEATAERRGLLEPISTRSLPSRFRSSR